MRILLIMPNFFEYPQIIKTELEQMGHIVDYFDDRPRACLKNILNCLF